MSILRCNTLHQIFARGGIKLPQESQDMLTTPRACFLPTLESRRLKPSTEKEIQFMLKVQNLLTVILSNEEAHR